MSTAAIIALQDMLNEAQTAYADIATDEKQTIDDGRRAQGRVDAAARRVEDYQRAINTLEAEVREQQRPVAPDA